MKEKSVKKNYIYNLIYHLLSLLTPLVVTPYISRVLGSYGIGQYSFTYSIITYFVLLASLGFGYYAQREVARFQNDKGRQTKVFVEILIARTVSTLVALVIHFVLIWSGIYGKTYSLLMWILTINIVSVAIDISFLFQGNEDFAILTLITSIFKVAGVVLIVVFVKKETHLWLYTLFQSLILIVSNVSMWFFLPRYLTKVKIRELNIKQHIVPCLRLFIPTVAVSVYTVLDKTLIGVMVTGTQEVNAVEIVDGIEKPITLVKSVADIENGFYDQAEKIVKMAMMIITSLGTVMIPKNSFIVASGEMDKFKNNIEKALVFVFFLGVPIMFGLAGVALNFSPWFFGPGYEKVPYLMMMFCPIILIIGISNVIGLQYLLPLKNDRKYTIAIVSGAIVNLVLNLVFIAFLKSFGACIATVVAEISVTTMMLIFAKKDISLLSIIRKGGWKYCLSGAIMFALVFITQHFLEPSVLNTIKLIFEGIFVYFIMLLVLRDSTMESLLKKTH